MQQQLVWLDAEISAAEAGKPPATPAATPSSVSATDLPADADAILARYATEERASPNRVKLGCWIAFLVLFVGFWGAIGLWYLLRAPS